MSKEDLPLDEFSLARKQRIRGQFNAYHIENGVCLGTALIPLGMKSIVGESISEAVMIDRKQLPRTAVKLDMLARSNPFVRELVSKRGSIISRVKKYKLEITEPSPNEESYSPEEIKTKTIKALRAEIAQRLTLIRFNDKYGSQEDQEIGSLERLHFESGSLLAYCAAQSIS